MEAIAAFALACNVMQVIEQAGSAIQVVLEVYRDGRQKDNGRLESQSEQLQKILKCLSQQSTPQDSSASGAAIKTELQSAASHCETLARSLCSELDGLKGSGGRLNALIVAAKISKKRGHIENLGRQLQQQREILETIVLVDLRRQILDLQTLQGETLNTMKSLIGDFQLENNNHMQQFLRELNSMHAQQLNATRQHIEGHITSELQSHKNETDLLSVRNRFLKSLTFSEMNTRMNAISDSETGTFEWMLNDSTDETLPDAPQLLEPLWLLDLETCTKKQAFKEWLSSGDKMFWIQGKAGAGKSTLMRFLWQHEKVQDLLCQQSSHQRCRILKYGFWLSGTPIQRSLNGLFMSLLHQILHDNMSCFQLLIQTNPEIINNNFNEDWSIRKLEKVLSAAIGIISEDAKICLFVDGLDEIGNRTDYPRVLQVVRHLSKAYGVKVCLSSRPEAYWSDNLKDEETIRLHDLTRKDICIFVVDRFIEAGYHPDTDNKGYRTLIEIISEKANGVFLWVKLAVESILIALDGRASWNEAEALVNALPPELNHLYESMLKKRGLFGQNVRGEAAAYFHMCLEFRHHPSDGQGTMAEIICLKAKLDGKNVLGENFGAVEFLQYYQDLSVRIPHLSAGMIEIEAGDLTSLEGKALAETNYADDVTVEHLIVSYKGMDPEPCVWFSHRTVVDFLQDTEAGQSLLSSSLLSVEDIFLSHVEAKLMAGLLNIATFDLRSLIGDSFGLFARSLSVSGETFTQALSMTEAILPDIGWHQNRLSALTKQMMLEDKRSAWPNIQFDLLCDTKDWTNLRSRNVVIDLTGIALTCGIIEPAQSCVDLQIVGDGVHGRKLTQRYKDYMLLCGVAAVFDLRDREEQFDFVTLLIHIGANPFAEFYLPEPKLRRCSAAVMLMACLLEQSISQDQRVLWVRLLRRIGIVSQHELIRVTFSLREGPCVDALWIEYWYNDYDFCDDVVLWIDLDVGMWLRSALQQLESSEFPGRCDLASDGGLLLKDRMMIQGKTPDYGSIAGDLSLLDEKNCEVVVSLLQRCHKDGVDTTNLSGRDEEITGGTRPHWSVLWRLLNELYRSSRQSRVNAYGYLKSIDMSADKTDPRVLNGPIPRYEEESSLPERIQDLSIHSNRNNDSHADDDENDQSDTSSSIFFDAEG